MYTIINSTRETHENRSHQIYICNITGERWVPIQKQKAKVEIKKPLPQQIINTQKIIKLFEDDKVKMIKKNLFIKYHPDKVWYDPELAKLYTRLCQTINYKN